MVLSCKESRCGDGSRGGMPQCSVSERDQLTTAITVGELGDRNKAHDLSGVTVGCHGYVHVTQLTCQEQAPDSHV
jgi:hypothetical protein